jgi:signal peptidase II
VRRLQERRPLSPRLIATLAAVAAIAADQATKQWALAALADGPTHLFWTLRLQLAFNTGASFSIGRGRSSAFTLLALAVVAILVASLRGLRSRVMAVGLGLVVGGALGNVTDRVLRAHDGAVVDFIDLQWWPVFNVADICIFCGTALLVLGSLRDGD